VVFPFHENHHYPVDHSFRLSVFSRSVMSQHFTLTFCTPHTVSIHKRLFLCSIIGITLLDPFPQNFQFCWFQLSFHEYRPLCFITSIPLDIAVPSN
jgi:hypothetical protein